VPSEARLDGRYQLDERIAAGGYGEVWRATDLILGRKVAVKLLLAQHVQQAETLARFRAEAQRAGALTQANIARVYDYVEPNPPQPPFLVMELIDGPSLAQVLADGPLPPAQVMDIIAGAAAGRVFAEVDALARARGCRPETFSGLAGVGDLVATVVASGAAGPAAETEAVDSVPLLATAAREARIESPALDGLAALVEGRIEPDQWAATVTDPPRRPRSRPIRAA